MTKIVLEGRVFQSQKRLYNHKCPFVRSSVCLSVSHKTPKFNHSTFPPSSLPYSPPLIHFHYHHQSTILQPSYNCHSPSFNHLLSTLSSLHYPSTFLQPTTYFHHFHHCTILQPSYNHQSPSFTHIITIFSPSSIGQVSTLKHLSKCIYFLSKSLTLSLTLL